MTVSANQEVSQNDRTVTGSDIDEVIVDVTDNDISNDDIHMETGGVLPNFEQNILEKIITCLFCYFPCKDPCYSFIITLLFSRPCIVRSKRFYCCGGYDCCCHGCCFVYDEKDSKNYMQISEYEDSWLINNSYKVYAQSHEEHKTCVAITGYIRVILSVIYILIYFVGMAIAFYSGIFLGIPLAIVLIAICVAICVAIFIILIAIFGLPTIIGFIVGISAYTLHLFCCYDNKTNDIDRATDQNNIDSTIDQNNNYEPIDIRNSTTIPITNIDEIYV